MQTKDIFEFIFLLILLFLAALTAASETAIIAVSRVRLRERAAKGSRLAKAILRILEAPARFFGTILVANTIVDILIACIVTAMMISWIGDENKGILFATAIVTLAIIVVEATAKTFAARRSDKLSFILVRPIEFLIWLFSPVVNILARITNLIIRAIGGRTSPEHSLVTEDEIKAFIKMGEEEGVIQKDEAKMLSEVLDFGDTTIRQVMTPKEKVVSLNINSKFEDIVKQVSESGYSRLPVYQDNPHNIIGVVNVKDLLKFWEDTRLMTLADIVHPPKFVSGSRSVSVLLKEFQKGRTHLAIVVDAQGKTEGIVTLEDLLEEIVGEIKDEYDLRDKPRGETK